MKAMMFLENMRIAIGSIRARLLRAVLTILIIAIGIGALVGILTAIDVMKEGISGNFTSMGANTFNIRNRSTSVHFGGRRQRKAFRSITWFEANRFKEAYCFPGTVSITCSATMNATVRYQSQKSNPNIFITGGDENFLITSGYQLQEGRNFSVQELQNGSNVVVIGSEIKKRFFPNTSSLDKIISVGPVKYKIIGCFREKGSSFGFSGDKVVLLPLKNVKQKFAPAGMSYVINVLSPSTEMLDATIDESIGLFRIIRGLSIREAQDFEITRSDSLSLMLIDNLQYVTIAATIIAFITLLGAAIGLMNIMLVAVNERTREIGIRKAVGATSSSIRNQFLVESIVISQIGGLAGILMGLLIGNVLSTSFDMGFIMPWGWMIVAVVVCLITGLLSGIIPAVKAARLNPIDALRFE